MDFIDHKIESYSTTHSTDESDLLKKIDRETHAEVLLPRMLSGKLQGRVLSAISHMVKPNRILEIGTYTGYSAICLAEGLQEDGKIITIDINEELENRVRGYFNESAYASKIEYLIGNALTIIPTLREQFDIVFIDADKINYLPYYHLIFDMVKKDGFIIADNVLWSGKVILSTEKKIDKDTEAILAFNSFVQKDTRVENVLLPLRDGLMIVRKK